MTGQERTKHRHHATLTSHNAAVDASIWHFLEQETLLLSDSRHRHLQHTQRIGDWNLATPAQYSALKVLCWLLELHAEIVAIKQPLPGSSLVPSGY